VLQKRIEELVSQHDALDRGETMNPDHRASGQADRASAPTALGPSARHDITARPSPYVCQMLDTEGRPDGKASDAAVDLGLRATSSPPP
jgi:hypothetical protein